jgi:hypothetical protein
MKTSDAESASKPAPESCIGRRHDLVAATRPGRLRQDRVSDQDNKAPHQSDAGAAVRSRPLEERIGGVDTVHTFGVGLGRTSVGSGRIPHVSAGAQCLQGLDSGSSPTSDTGFPTSEGFCF